MQICGKKSLETFLNKFFFWFWQSKFGEGKFQDRFASKCFSVEELKQKNQNFLDFQKLLLKIFYEWKFLVLKSSQIR